MPLKEMIVFSQRLFFRLITELTSFIIIIIIDPVFIIRSDAAPPGPRLMQCCD